MTPVDAASFINLAAGRDTDCQGEVTSHRQWLQAALLSLLNIHSRRGPDAAQSQAAASTGHRRLSIKT